MTKQLKKKISLIAPFIDLKFFFFLKWFGQFSKQLFGYFFIILFHNMIFKLSILPFLNCLHYLKLFESELISVKDGG